VYYKKQDRKAPCFVNALIYPDYSIAASRECRLRIGVPKKLITLLVTSKFGFVMYLYWDIEGKAKLIEKRLGAIGLLSKSFIGFVNYPYKYLNAKIDEFILAVDGLQKHAPDFNTADAKLLFEQTKKTCKIFEKLDDILGAVNYGNDAALKSKFKYSLKAIYKLESLLHIAYTKDFPVQKTPLYIKEGLALMSNQANSAGLSKIA
jgi:hypothetical protein